MPKQVVLFLVFGSILLSFPSQAQRWADFNIVTETAPDTYDPYSTKYGKAGAQLSALIYQPLYRVEDPALPPVPVLADTSWWASGNRYHIRLRSGVFWHDENPLTVEDVVTSYDTAIRGNVDAELAAQLNSWVRSKGSFFKSVRAVNNRTIELVFQTKPAEPRQYLDLPILPKHIFWLNGRFQPCLNPDRVVGTGPVKLVSWNKLTKMGIFRPFHGYFRDFFVGESEHERLRLSPFLQVVIDINARIEALRTCGIHLLAPLPPQYIPEFDRDPRFRGIDYPSYAIESIALNFDNRILRVKAVRQAMMYALNRRLMLETVLQNQGDIANGPFSKATSCQCDDANPYEYDPRRAISILEEAGFERKANGSWESPRDGILKFRLVAYLSQNSARETILGAVQQNLEKIGIMVDLQQIRDFQTFRQTVFEDEDFDMATIEWNYNAGGGVADVFHSRSQRDEGARTSAENYNFINYENEEVDQLIDAFDSAEDMYERLFRCQELDKVLNEEVPYLFLWTTNRKAIVCQLLRRIRNVTITPLTIYDTFEEWYAEEPGD